MEPADLFDSALEDDAQGQVQEHGGRAGAARRHAAGAHSRDAAAVSAVDPDSPLAVRMRPQTLDELLGQQHLLAPGSPLRRLVEGDAPLSVILWGPPGSGKTTVAHIVSRATKRRFVRLSALSAGVKDVRAVIDEARQHRATGEQTVLFLDEVHRFSKTQQDSLLSAVEDRTIALVAATTENPYFSIVSPLLSRSLLLTLEPLTDDHIRLLITRALTDERGLAERFTMENAAENHIVRVSGGDARKALTALEAAAGSADARGASAIDLAITEQAIDQAALRYDRDGDAHYDVASALIKSLRGSDVDAALHWLAKMIVAGEDPRFIARRLVIFASEDIGMADPTALQIAVASMRAVQMVGLPEGRINLAQAAIHLATAPKSNAVIRAIDAAIGDIKAGQTGSVPVGLRDPHYPGAKRIGHGKGYRYPHDDPQGIVPQQYPPDEAVGRDYYHPGEHGAERQLVARVQKLRAIVREAPAEQ